MDPRLVPLGAPPIKAGHGSISRSLSHKKDLPVPGAPLKSDEVSIFRGNKTTAKAFQPSSFGGFA